MRPKDTCYGGATSADPFAPIVIRQSVSRQAAKPPVVSCHQKKTTSTRIRWARKCGDCRCRTPAGKKRVSTHGVPLLLCAQQTTSSASCHKSPVFKDTPIELYTPVIRKDDKHKGSLGDKCGRLSWRTRLEGKPLRSRQNALWPAWQAQRSEMRRLPQRPEIQEIRGCLCLPVTRKTTRRAQSQQGEKVRAMP